MSKEKQIDDTGKWELGKSGCIYFCPNCEYAAMPREAREWNFCPICGEKMKEADHKQSEVAREIFADLEPWLEDFRKNCCTGLQFITFLSELKKKYCATETNDGSKTEKGGERE